MKYLVLGTAILAIAACSDMGADKKDEKMSNAVSVTPKSEQAKMSFVDTRDLQIKTFAMVNGVRTEVTGAACLLDSEAFSASVTTPGMVAMPILSGAKPSPLGVNCSKGSMAGNMKYDAVPVALGTQAAGVTDAGGIVDASSVVTTNAYVYSGAALIMPIQSDDKMALQQAQTAVLPIEVDLK